MLKLQFIGHDGWGRIVYQDQFESIWKDIGMGTFPGSLYRACDDAFDGEPDYPIDSEYEIVE